MNRLSGQVAFITGAARGQGRSHAVRLAQEGASIIAVDICKPIETAPYPAPSPADLEETVRLVEEAGGKIVAAQADVRDLASLEAAVDEGMNVFDRLDIVIANAGIAAQAPSLTMSEEMWNTTVDINLTGVWRTLKVTIPHVIAGDRGGAVVITSSLVTRLAPANMAHYTAAKSGLVGLMKVLAKELAPQRIRVNTLHPAMVATEMVLGNDGIARRFNPDIAEPTREDFDRAARALNLLPYAMLESDDVSNAVLYLVTDDGKYVTGTTQMLNLGCSI